MIRRCFIAGWVVWLGLAGSGLHAESNDPALWFPVGERLIYRLYWGVIPVGQAEFSTEWKETAGGSNILIRVKAKTTAVVARIYPVNDDITSEVDAETFLPVRFEQILNEGRHHRHDIFTFDHARREAIWESPLKGRTNAIPIDADTRDILSFIYYMRSKGYEVGKEETFKVVTNSKVYDLFVRGAKKEELSLDGFGKIPCLVVEPQAKFGEIFVRQGRAWVWFSEDSRRVCVRMAAKVPVASVKGVLTEVKGPGSELWPPKDEGGEAGGVVRQKEVAVR